ncbi:uncharacterized protein LOC100899062 [Galendromus occidentalis]|uniref:Uncharacterized protein LOC100899062 n=1 Tax=Galendromus occidentalis TaxID=34638 RepID=A0AAJ6VW82_9ACAR|nr:uncharacterized protein LOC100899062 [Galendromus occidentalis]
MDLCSAPVVHMDGTFRVVPKLFLQLYSLHAFYRGEIIPMAFFLLPNKQMETYGRMFSLLKNYAHTIGVTFNPPGFQLDFEVATFKSIEESFPLATVRGCSLHFAQCLWRKVQDLALKHYYKDPNVKRLMRSVGALALVPLSHVDDAWLDIEAEAPSSDHPAHVAVESFKEYVIGTWLENAAVFPRSLCNHFRNFGARTTNHLEGWHQGLNRGIGRSHVNIFEMIAYLQKLERWIQNSDAPP